MNEPNYKIRLVCGNCYHKWNEEFPKGFPCEETGYSRKQILKPQGIQVKCPICECTDIRKVFPEERGNK